MLRKTILIALLLPTVSFAESCPSVEEMALGEFNSAGKAAAASFNLSGDFIQDNNPYLHWNLNLSSVRAASRDDALEHSNTALHTKNMTLINTEQKCQDGRSGMCECFYLITIPYENETYTYHLNTWIM